jgi:GT2 family glycosyltransferase
MKTDIVVVGFNIPEFEANTLKAVIAHTVPGTYRLTYAQNTPGRSLAAFWNELIAPSPCPYICLLNPDTVPARGWLERMLAVYDTEPNVGAVVPSCNIVQWSTVPVPFPREETNWDKINRFAGALTPEVVEGPVLSATCILFEKRVWQTVGRFDEEFQVYGEDTEFSWRLKNRFGYRLLWQKGAFVHHYKAQAVQKAVLDGTLNYEQCQLVARALMERKTGTIGGATGMVERFNASLKMAKE